MFVVFTLAKASFVAAAAGWTTLGVIATLSDPVVAGVFALVNTVLNAATIYFLHRFLSGVPPKIDRATEILETQQGNMAKREGDTPPEGVK